MTCLASLGLASASRLVLLTAEADKPQRFSHAARDLSLPSSERVPVVFLTPIELACKARALLTLNHGFCSSETTCPCLQKACQSTFNPNADTTSAELHERGQSFDREPIPGHRMAWLWAQATRCGKPLSGSKRSCEQVGGPTHRQPA